MTEGLFSVCSQFALIDLYLELFCLSYYVPKQVLDYFGTIVQYIHVHVQSGVHALLVQFMYSTCIPEFLSVTIFVHATTFFVVAGSDEHSSYG